MSPYREKADMPIEETPRKPLVRWWQKRLGCTVVLVLGMGYAHDHWSRSYEGVGWAGCALATVAVAALLITTVTRGVDFGWDEVLRRRVD